MFDGGGDGNRRRAGVTEAGTNAKVLVQKRGLSDPHNTGPLSLRLLPNGCTNIRTELERTLTDSELLINLVLQCDKAKSVISMEGF